MLDPDAASDMLDWDNGGFSLNASVCIGTNDREGLERLIRYCARPVFSGERLDIVGERLKYVLPKPTADGQTILLLKPTELLDKLAQLIPPPKRHRHHYHGVLAPNSPTRAKIIGRVDQEPASEAVAAAKEDPELPFLIPNTSQTEKAGPQVKSQPPCDEDAKTELQQQPKAKKQPSKASLFRWAMLMARIFEVFPLSCPQCDHPMRIIAFIKDGHSVRKILNHINEPSSPPAIASARGPPESEFDYDQMQDVAYAD